MSNMIFISLIILGAYSVVYAIFFAIFSRSVKNAEKEIVKLFLAKVSKIPALIEVMRPHVAEESAFDRLTLLHSESMIQAYNSIYDLLEHNARIHDQFLFLMKLSVHIPSLQRKAYFLYIRDFIIAYDRDMQSKFSVFNTSVSDWNRFVIIKNMTIIGLVLPGRSKMRV